MVLGKGRSEGRISLVLKTEEGQETEIEGPLVAGYINDFFCGIGPKLAERHNDPWNFFGVTNEAVCPDMFQLKFLRMRSWY